MHLARYAGLFNAEGLAVRLEACRAALNEYQLSRTDAIESTQIGPPTSPDPWREDDEEAVDAEESAGMQCECGQRMESARRIDPAPTMKLIAFVRDKVSTQVM